MIGPWIIVAVGFLAALAPVYLRLPDLPLGIAEGLLLAGVLWGWLAFRRRRTWKRGLAAGAMSIAVAFHLAWLAGFSTYGDAPEAPALGAPAPDLHATRVRDGAGFQLAAQRGRPVLLLFFRGAW